MEGGAQGAGEGAGAVARQNLQQRLLDAVKQCQIHFGARQEMATETDLRVGTLCVEWEAVLLHGMRKTKSKPPLKQFAGLGKTEVSLWPLAQLCLSQDETQRFLNLTHIRSDTGRGRAWLRASINERTLETYLHLILDNPKLKSLYESHAFLLDQERASMLPIMAAGLGSILFSIPVDAEYLNAPTRNLDTSLVATPLSTGPASKLLDVRPNQNGHTMEDSVVRKKKKSNTRTPNEGGGAKSDSEIHKEVGVVELRGVTLLPRGVSPDNLSSSPSLASLGSDLETPRYVALDTLLGNHSNSEAEAEAAATATAMVLNATFSPSPPLPRPHPLPAQGPHTFSPDELREALLAMVRTKDELDENNRHLEAELREVREERDRLVLELSRSQAELTSLHSTHIPQQALERENDVLKEQLKMMVKQRASSVRLDDSTMEGSAAYEEEELLSSGTMAPRPHPPGHTPSENKLSEMADMHGELLELNDRLQRDMALKDHYITKLINILQEAGLQVPSPRAQSPPATLKDGHNELVSVWIPSVIKRGRGPEAHHIYQVFVRIRDQEWNVYRRYAEFREFHKQLQQCIPEVASFQFPPKKALGNKSAHLVEERRQKLQDYLRVVMRLCTEPRTVQGKHRKHHLDPIMKKDIDRDTLQDILPFFKEDMHSSAPAIPQNHRLSYSGL